MVGRGLRTSSRKKDCLLIDLANCYIEHGTISNPNVTWKEKSEGGGTRNSWYYTEICPHCETVIEKGLINCPECGESLEEEITEIDNLQLLHNIKKDVKSISLVSVEEVDTRKKKKAIKLSLNVQGLGIVEHYYKFNDEVLFAKIYNEHSNFEHKFDKLSKKRFLANLNRIFSCNAPVQNNKVVGF